MDQRGKGKVRKSDFLQAVERMRISLAREDVTKVWGFLDTNKAGYIQLQELSNAYANKIHNFNKQVETAVETKAVAQYKKQQSDEIEESKNEGRVSLTQRNTNNVGQSARSPLTRKSIEHIYGA